MPHLTIPEEYVAGLVNLIVLPDAAIEELTLALADNQSPLDVRDAGAATSLISAKVPSASTKDLRRVMATLLSLHNVRASSEVPANEFIDDIVLAMKRSGRANLSLEDSEVYRKFRNRLKGLLDVKSLKTASKAVVIQHEHEHTLCSLRIFTDARPVFEEDLTSPPSAVAITHMLKLIVHEGNEMREIHVALDREDLTSLKSQIARAEGKVAGLHKVFESAKIRVVE